MYPTLLMIPPQGPTLSKPRLIYFDFAGSRGEECRIALHLAGCRFRGRARQERRLARDEGDMPFGAMPVLEIPGKAPLAHSNAILVFIGRQHGFIRRRCVRGRAPRGPDVRRRGTAPPDTPTLRIADPTEAQWPARRSPPTNSGPGAARSSASSVTVLSSAARRCRSQTSSCTWWSLADHGNAWITCPPPYSTTARSCCACIAQSANIRREGLAGQEIE